jgi:V/A-type H+/Na+-transporting ATPase subunit A
VARGGTAAIPGGFGTGKTVLEQQIAKWADADVVVYVGCGERGNELAEVLEEFPQLPDPRAGGTLMDRTVIVANTSNMSVTAREASIYTGVTIAEYFRDQGRHVALLTDSTSRWGEALREISGRLEEMPAEEGYPAYLASRVAGFYERAGAVICQGGSQRAGSVTIIGAVSPPSGDFSEPITQHTLRMTGTFWALDRDLARARHFPAVDWRRSYTLYQLSSWFSDDVAASWPRQREWALDMLQQETSLLEIVQLLGADTLPAQQQVVLRTGQLLREDFLQQSSFDETDAYCPLEKQHAMLSVVMAAHQAMSAAVTDGTPAAAVTGAPILGEITRMRAWPPEEAARRAGALARDITERLAALEGDRS